MNKTIPLSRHIDNVSPLVIGCMGLGGGWNQNPISDADIQQTHQLIDTGLEAGINVFDHADIYTFGKAEQVFGKVLQQRPELREQLILQSKCGIRFEDENGPKRFDFSKNWIQHSVDNILKRLNTDKLDILMLHRPDPLMEVEEVAEAFSELKQTGKVASFGVSNMHSSQIAFLQSALDVPLVCNQLELSLSRLDWLEQNINTNVYGPQNGNFDASMMAYCQQHSIQIQAWGSLSQGLFTGQDVSQQPQHIQQTANLVARLANDYQVSREAIVIAFLLRHPANIQPVLGSTKPDRIKACAQALNISLSREHWYALYVAARGQELP